MQHLAVLGEGSGAQQVVGKQRQHRLVERFHPGDEGIGAGQGGGEQRPAHALAGVDEQRRRERQLAAPEGHDLLFDAVVVDVEGFLAQAQIAFAVARHGDEELLEAQLHLLVDAHRGGLHPAARRGAARAVHDGKELAADVFLADVGGDAEGRLAHHADRQAVDQELDAVDGLVGRHLDFEHHATEDRLVGGRRDDLDLDHGPGRCRGEQPERDGAGAEPRSAPAHRQSLPPAPPLGAPERGGPRAAARAGRRERAPSAKTARGSAKVSALGLL